MSRLKLGVVGLGRVANCHLHAIAQLPDLVELHALVDVDQSRLGATAQKYPAPKSYLSVDNALKDESIDGFVVCLPHFLHHLIAKQIMESGRHVLMEKPLALNFAETKDLVERARKHGVVLMGAQSRRFYEAIFEALRRMPEIGRPLTVSYIWADRFSTDWSPPWWMSKEKTGGFVIPLCGAHAFDYVLWLMGEAPETIYAKTYTNPNLVWEGEDQLNCILAFRDGSTASILLSATADPEVHEVVHIGSKGSIKYAGGDEHTQEILGFTSIDLWVKGERAFSGRQPQSNFVLQMREFHDAIRGKQKAMATGTELLRLSAALDAAARSAVTGLPEVPQTAV